MPRSDGDVVPLNTEKYSSCSQVQPLSPRPCSWQSRDGTVCDVTEPENQGMLGTEGFDWTIKLEKGEEVY